MKTLDRHGKRCCVGVERGNRFYLNIDGMSINDMSTDPEELEIGEMVLVMDMYYPAFFTIRRKDNKKIYLDFVCYAIGLPTFPNKSARYEQYVEKA